MPRYLGQHFLVDTSVLDTIVDGIAQMVDATGAHTLREIGPGQGALTKKIYGLVPSFVCFEKDTNMKKYLGQFLQAEQIVRGDVLDDDNLPYTDDMNRTLVVGNLPYYITSPILRKFFAGDIQPQGGVFLIQKEVADKLASDARKKSYLWRLINNAYTVEYMLTVAPESFDPPPKVESAVIALHRRTSPILSPYAYDEMLAFLDLVSPYTRKTLGKIQKMLQKKGIDLTLPEHVLTMRLEELSWEEMAMIVDLGMS